MTFSEQFPVLSNYTYVNTANSGILSRQAAEWRRMHDEEFVQQGSVFKLNLGNFLQGVREDVARFFNAKADNTFLVPNFSYGFNIVLDGLGGPQRCLLLQEDYPSVNFPIENRGWNCHHVPITEHLEQNIVEAVAQYKPTVLALSLVQYISGIKIDLNFLRQLKNDNPDLLIIADGTQYCGTEVFDFEQSGIDILLASNYKWMLAGYGNGVVVMRDTAKPLLYAKAQQKPLPREAFLQDKSVLSMYFEPGHLDTLNFGTLQQSIKYLEQVGLDFIQTRIQELIRQAKTAFAERGLLSPAVLAREQHSSIFNLSLPIEVFNHLQQNGIITSCRGSGIRVSFHFYNTDNDLQQLLEGIDKHR